MDIRVLRYFLAAAEQQSISGAAQKLHVTQPTLSRQFMELEEELGHTLFVRSNRKLRLTPKGELFYERARSIVNLFDRTKEEIRAKVNSLATSALPRAKRLLWEAWRAPLLVFSKKHPKLGFTS